MKLHVFPASPNARKCILVNSLLGLDIEEVFIDLRAGEQRSEEFLALNPNGKMPVLEMDDGTSLWESNAIINYMAALGEADIWPKSNQRYDIMRWQFWEACHLMPACSKFIRRHFFGREDIDMEKATEEVQTLGAVLDGHLASRDWLSGDAMTTADISVSAILCYREACSMPVSQFENLATWLARVEALPAWKLANAD
ncbi:MAG: glutathione S-transferase family protein [Pseudomonadota bacterium]